MEVIKSGLLQQVVFKCRFYLIDVRRDVVSKEWSLNPLPDNTILGLPKLNAFADDKLNITQNI